MGDKLTVGVGQAHELERAFERNGWSNSQIKDACKGDFLGTVRRLLTGDLIVKATELLAFMSQVSVPAVKKFVTSKAFVIDTSATAKVKIGYLGENFKTSFLAKVEKNIPATTLAVHRLIKNSLDQPIRDQLGDKSETTLAQLYHLLCQQPNGEAGPLLTNGYWNIFYIKDAKGQFWAVSARWNACYGDWLVDASRVDDPGEWFAGDQVVSQV